MNCSCLELYFVVGDMSLLNKSKSGNAVLSSESLLSNEHRGLRRWLARLSSSKVLILTFS